MIRDSVKRRITKAILEQIPNCDIDLDRAMKTFWLDIRNEGGLRLSDVGEQAFKVADIENLMLDLSQKLPCPYYIGRKKPSEPYIKIYDSKIAMLINLYGDIYDYLRNSNIRRK